MSAVSRPAHSVVRAFEPAPAETFELPRHHYLVSVSRGALRLERDGTVWSLPPARAALVAAGQAIEVTVPQAVVTSSVLVEAGFAPPPDASLSVFDLTPLARALLQECGRWEESDEPLGDYALALFRALVEVTWELARHPSPARMPSGRSPEVRRALSITGLQLAADPRMDRIAAEIGLAPRSLARRFEDELGMTWRSALRRMRVLRAIELLAGSEASVTEISLAVGYGSLSAFQAAFRDLVGQTPTEYRAGFRP